MLIKHLVLLSFKPSLSSTEIEKVMLALSDLRKVIPQITSFLLLENNSPENLHQGYLHGFVMGFNSEADRQIYLDHPEHVKVAQEIVIPALADGHRSLIVFDYPGEN